MKFDEKTEEILMESKMLKVELPSSKNYDRMDGLVTMSAVNDIAKGLRQIGEDLEGEGYAPDEIASFAYALVDKIIREG